MKVLISDNLSKQGVDILKNAGLEVDARAKTSVDELMSIIGDYDALIIRSATKVNEQLLDAAKKLKIVGRAGSGLDNVDIPASTKRGVIVMNTPGGNTITTAEHTIGMLFAAARYIPQAAASLKQGQWEKKKFMGIELNGKTLGIIGIGNIGGVVANRAQGLKMNVIAFDPFISPEKVKEMGIELVSMDELYKRADFISIHTPLTKETNNLINKDTIAKMKNGVRILNCARGGIINEQDLYEALKSGKVAAAAFDVFEKEPPENNPLLALDNFIGTPHLGASTEEAQENVAVAIAEQIVDYLVRGTIRNAVNVPSVPADILPKLQPFITLGERLGSFESQLYEGALTEVIVEYRGEVAELNVAPITIAILKGLLTPILTQTVNYVNAPIIAKERGVNVKESKVSEVEDFTSLITLKVKSGSKTSVVSGTLYNKKEPRIVQIDEFPIEAVPEGYMLILYNNDKPGVIGNIGGILGKNNINIARMQFGRVTQGGKAISVVGIDTPVSPSLLEDIKKLPNVLSVRQIKI